MVGIERLIKVGGMTVRASAGGANISGGMAFYAVGGNVRSCQGEAGPAVIEG